MRTAFIVCVAGFAFAVTGARGAGPPAPYVLAYVSKATPSVIDAVRADGSDVRVLVAASSGAISLANWSPDGSRLVYEQDDAPQTYSSVATVGLHDAPP